MIQTIVSCPIKQKLPYLCQVKHTEMSNLRLLNLLMFMIMLNYTLLQNSFLWKVLFKTFECCKGCDCLCTNAIGLVVSKKGAKILQELGREGVISTLNISVEIVTEPLLVFSLVVNLGVDISYSFPPFLLLWFLIITRKGCSIV